MTAKTKPQPAASTTRQSLDALTRLIAPFGWSIDEKGCRLFTTSHLAMCINWCNDESAEQEAAPEAIWKLIDVPYDQRKAFRDENDVRALLCTLLTYRQDFISMAAHPDHALELLADNISINGGKTTYGAIYLETEPIAAVWFGKKAGQLPALGGPLLMDALDRLLNVAVTAPRDEPPASAVQQPKSTARRMAAKKEKPDRTEVDPATGNVMQSIDITKIVPDVANRKISDESVQSLADNIKAVGLLQPITVRPMQSGDRYMITAGERRWRACLKAGFKTIPAIIRETVGVATDVSRISENVLRENLTPSELAAEYSRLLESGKTQAEVGKLFGVTQGQISNTIRLLKLPTSILKHVDSGMIAPTLIREVLRYCEYRPVMDAVESMVNKRISDEVPIESGVVRDCLRNALLTHSRSMTYEASWANYQNPDPKKRHFKTLTDEDKNALAPANFKELLSTWEGQDRTFNLDLFGKLNAKPLAERRKKHAAHKATHSAPKSANGPEKACFTNQHRVADDVADILAKDLATVMEAHRDKATVYRMSLAILINEEGQGNDAILGKRQWQRDEVFKLYEALNGTPKQIEDKIRKVGTAMLRSDYMPVGVDSLLQFGRELSVDLLSTFKASEDLIDLMTDHGREVCQSDLQVSDASTESLIAGWTPGYMPAFLRELVAPEPAKKKKGKAA